MKLLENDLVLFWDRRGMAIRRVGVVLYPQDNLAAFSTFQIIPLDDPGGMSIPVPAMDIIRAL